MNMCTGRIEFCGLCYAYMCCRFYCGFPNRTYLSSSDFSLRNLFDKARRILSCLSVQLFPEPLLECHARKQHIM